MCFSSIITVAQTYNYEYPAISVTGSTLYPNNGTNGTGTFSSTSVIPNFTWSITTSGSKLRKLETTLEEEEMMYDNPWETKYGQVDLFTPCFRMSHGGNASFSGNPLGIPLTLTITFPTPAKAYGWGFMVLDMDVDQVDIMATRPDGSSFSNNEINEWFQGAGNANGASDACWDSYNATVVGSAHAISYCERRTELMSGTDDNGGYAFFEPNALVKTITFRYYSLQASATPSYRVFLAASRAVTATGTVYNDITGTTDGSINGTPISTAGASQLYAYMVNSSKKILDSTIVRANGSFSFLPQSASFGSTAYKVLLSTSSSNIGITNPPVTLPAQWRSTGENMATTYAGGNNDGDGAANQSLSFNVTTNNIININFGIQRPPQSAVRAETIGTNPGGTINATVNPIWFRTSNVGSNPNTSDFDGGTIGSIRITPFPSNATSITINGTRYGSCSGCTAWPAIGVTVPYNSSTGTTQAIAVDPVDGLVDVIIRFNAIDNANAASITAGSVLLAFTAILPVQLESFIGKMQTPDKVLLEWQVSEEMQINGYEIMYSTNGTDFKSVGNQPASNNKYYSFNHLDNFQNVFYYQIRTNEKDGSFTYSKVISIRKAEDKEVSVAVYPNPAKDYLVVQLDASAKATVLLSDLLGRTVKQVALTGGINRMSVSALPSGIYYVRVVKASGDQFVTKVVIQ